ncbi:MAG: B12-binding domain-containing radical SAM protein [Nitrospirota bacterium]
MKSVEFVLSEIEMLIEKYKINAIMFDDDEFDLNKKWIRHFCEEIIERELKFIWHCNSRCNYAEKEIYLLMYDAGCRSVSFGIEFGNQKILDFAMKQLTVEQIEKGVKYAKGAGLNVAGYFMMGMMGETEETIKDTINLALRLPLDSGSFGLTVPMIGTELYNMALREGYISKEYWGQWVRTRALVNMTKNLSQNQLNKYVRMANWQFFWSRPRRRIPKTIRKIIIRLFPILYFFTGKKFGEVVFLVNGVRRFLRIPLS